MRQLKTYKWLIGTYLGLNFFLTGCSTVRVGLKEEYIEAGKNKQKAISGVTVNNYELKSKAVNHEEYGFDNIRQEYFLNLNF